MMKLVLLLCIVLATNGFEPAKFAISAPGNRFEAANAVELLSTFTNIRAVLPCAMLCYGNSQCRTFDFDSSSKECRLFEGSVDTGNLVPNLSSSVVGWINMLPSMFSLYNASNDQCVNNRYLDSETLSGRCECQIHTFWNGSMCLNQKYAGDACINNNSCRIDLAIICISLVCVAPPPPACTPQPTLGGALFSVTNPSSSNYPTYTCYAYTWVATGSSVTLSFFFRQDPGGWMLDDVEVYHGWTEMIVNGGFETGNLIGWNHSGTCNTFTGMAYSGSSYAKSGNYYYYDICGGTGDILSQTFLTVAGDTYMISFWLTNYDCCTATEIANITLV